MGKGSSGGGMSLLPKDFTKGGGTEGAIATIDEIGFIGKFTYGGRFKDHPSAALYVKYNIEGFAKPWDCNFSVGKSDRYEVVDDGDGIQLRDGSGGGLNEGAPAAAFLRSVVEAAEVSGLDLDDLLPELSHGGNSVRPLEGRKVRLKNIKLKTQGGDEREYQVIAAFLDEDEKPASKKVHKSADVEEKTKDAIRTIVEEKRRVKATDLGVLLNDEYKKDPDLRAMVQLSMKANILGDIDGIDYDSKKGYLTPAK